MMTREMIMKQAEALGEDAFCRMDSDGDLHITFNDCDGYDDDRAYDDPDAIETFIERLENEAHEVCGDFYTYYTMDGFTVKVGYLSFDI